MVDSSSTTITTTTERDKGLAGQWHGDATGTSPQIIGPNEYVATVTDSTGSNAKTIIPEGVSYDPQINSAPKMKIKVEPDVDFEGTTYLGGTLVIDVDGSKLFEGEIKKISPNQQEEPYEVVAHSFGRRLDGQSVDETANNIIVYDYLGEKVDYYNTVDSDLDAKHNTADETLTDVIDAGGIVKKVADGKSSGTAKYDSVGSDASKLRLLYVKAYTPGTDDITVEIKTSTNTYSETISSADKNIYGEWVQIDPTSTFNSDTGVYSITFTINGSARLSNWRAMQTITLRRDIHTPDISNLSTGTNIYTYDSTEINTKGSATGNVVNTGSSWRVKQVTTWETFTDESTNITSDADATGGSAYAASKGVTSPFMDFGAVNDDIEEWELWGRVKKNTDGGNDTWDVTVTVGSDSESHTIGTTGISTTSYDWIRVSAHDFDANFPTNFSGETIEVQTQNVSGTDEMLIGTMVVINTKDGGLVSASDFDNTLDSSSGHLDYPHIYAYNDRYGTNYIEFDKFVNSVNISKATTTATMSNISNGIDPWGVQHKINDSDPYFASPPNNDTVTTDFSHPGVIHRTKCTLTASGTTRNDSPREGYQSMEVSQIDVTGDENDLSVLYNVDSRDSRLGVMSSVADETDALFRWDAFNCEIFQRGILTTNPDLRKEKINSDISIEGVYSSVEVIGTNGVTSGTIASSNAPAYVDDHKQILSQDVDTAEDAKVRARDFLIEHGDVRYMGTIDTLPTFAPVGAEMDGSHFSHGQSMIIQSVKYTGTNASVKLGFEKNIADNLVGLSKESHNNKVDATSN